ncbi:MAG: hypothetical protein AAF843_05965 [Bacteroidota bacterium]
MINHFQRESVNGLDSLDSLADAVEKVVTDNAYRKALEFKNYQAAASLDMSEIADWYLLHFGRIMHAA